MMGVKILFLVEKGNLGKVYFLFPGGLSVNIMTVQLNVELGICKQQVHELRSYFCIFFNKKACS